MTDCIFCKIADGRIPANIVGRNDAAVAFRDLNPQAPTHVLVIPTMHLSGMAEMTTDESERAVARTLRLARDIAAELGLAENGYRLVINTGRDGGQSVFHLHVHLLAGRRLAWPPG
ncbi:MAG: histidine triad nucleotide-binding protein [Gemmatimonadetes bacterium]|nr:histidine triad nucleotide-binding protein [Gemmatimonadota bacterium]